MRARERRRLRRLVEQEVLGELPSAHRARLHEHLRSDARSRSEYDRAVEAFRILEDRDVARAEIDLVEQWLFDEHSVASDDVAPIRGRSGGRLWSIAAVTSASAAAAVLALRIDTGGSGDAGWSIKNGSSRRPGLAIEALCGRTSAGDTRLQPASEQGCPLTGTLAFAYRVDPSSSISAGVLALFGIDARGNVSYYAPTPVDPLGFEVTVGRWQPLPLSIDLDVNHAPGTVRLYGVVTPVPLTVDDVDEAASILSSRPPEEAETTIWTVRLGGRGRLAEVCAPPGACLTAQLVFDLHEESQ